MMLPIKQKLLIQQIFNLVKISTLQRNSTPIMFDLPRSNTGTNPRWHIDASFSLNKIL